MNIVLLYGPGEVSKRNYLLNIKKEFSPDQIFQVDLKHDNLADLGLKISSDSLFESGERLVMAENVSDKLDLETIKESNSSLTLVLVAAHPPLTSPILKSAKKINAKIYVFEGEKELNVFPFLDNLIERKKESFLELNKLFLEYGTMYILTMIYYLLRRNILPLPTSDFMKKKIQRQKQEFNLQDFEKLYLLTLQTEFKIKSGLVNEKIALTSLIQNFME